MATGSKRTGPRAGLTSPGALWYLGGYLFAFVLGHLAEHFVLHSPAGPGLRETGGTVLHAISGSARSGPEPLVVVDISQLRPTRGTPDDPVTSDLALTSVLRLVLEQKPLAVAFDLDFSAEAGQQADEHRRFLLAAQRLSQQHGIKVFAGVGRAMHAGATEPLADPVLRGMAASTLGAPGHPTIYPVRLRARGLPGIVLGNEPRFEVPSLAAALVDAGPGQATTPLLTRVFGSPHVELPGGAERDWDVDFALIDPSPLSRRDQWIVKLAFQDGGDHKEVVPLAKPEDLARLAGRMVLVGDVSPQSARDMVVIHGEMTPGVLLHACAAITLATRPVRELRHSVATAIGLLFLVWFLSQAIIALKRGHYDQTGDTARARVWERRFRILAPLVSRLAGHGPAMQQKERTLTLLKFFQCVVLLAVPCVLALFGVFWFDFVAVVALMLLETSLHHAVSALLGGLLKCFPH